MMETSPRKRTVGLSIIALMALAQSVIGVLRALNWFKMGSDLVGQGLLLIPLGGMIAYARGGLVAAIALGYILFAWGLFTQRDWARPLGITVAVVNLLLVLSVLIQGEEVSRALLWTIVPLIILWYLISANPPGTWRAQGVRT
jgi:hypothetical protein